MPVCKHYRFTLDYRNLISLPCWLTPEKIPPLHVYYSTLIIIIIIIIITNIIVFKYHYNYNQHFDFHRHHDYIFIIIVHLIDSVAIKL